MKLISQKGSAVVELAVAAWIVVFLLTATVEFFTLIETANRNAVAVRVNAFQSLEEDRPGLPGCGGNGDLLDGARNLTTTVPGTTLTVFGTPRVIGNYSVSAPVGHKNDLYGCNYNFP